jgi:hypothetical protein
MEPIDPNDYPDFLLWREMKRSGHLVKQPNHIELSEGQVLRLYAAKAKAINKLNQIKRHPDKDPLTGQYLLFPLSLL